MCRGKQALPTPVQIRAAPPSVLASLLTEHQASHASLALAGVKCVLAILSSESQSEPISGADRIALQGCVTSIVRSHPHHAPIKEGGTLALFALARSAGGRRRMLGGLHCLRRYGLGRARAGTRLPHGKQASRPKQALDKWGQP